VYFCIISRLAKGNIYFIRGQADCKDGCVLLQNIKKMWFVTYCINDICKASHGKNVACLVKCQRLSWSVVEGIDEMKNSIAEFIKYSIYGAIATVINLIFFVLFKRFGIHYISSNSLSYLIAVIVNYFLNKKYVFKTKSVSFRNLKCEFLKFFGVRMLSLAAENALLYMVVDGFHVNVYTGKIGIGFLMIIAVFLANKIFVFKKDGIRDEK